MLEAVTPVRPAAGYVGGKRNLAKTLLSMIAAIPHTTYAEVFIGMGGIFLRRDQRPQAEVINDLSEDVSTFFRILQRHYVAFLDMLRFQLTSRAGFERLLKVDPTTLTDLERAARFLYLQRIAFGGQVATRSYGVSPTNGARFDLNKLTPLLEAIHERLSPVSIKRLNYQKFIARYDRPGTLFYLDPPYYGCEGDYGVELFTRSDFEAMAEQLSGIAGRFILSINDHPDIRRTFAAFNIVEVQTPYSTGAADRNKKITELVISNG